MKEQNIFWGANLKLLRQRKRWSQEELAEKLGISRPKLNAHENGNTVNPPLEDLIKCSTFFSLGIDTLVKVNLAGLSELKIRELEAGNDAFATGTHLRVLATTVDKENNENTELVPEKAKAGYRGGYTDPQFIASLPRYSIPGLSKHSTYRMFPVSGDSMLPFPEGSYFIGEYVADWLSLKDGTPCVLILKSSGPDFVFKLVDNRIGAERKLVARSLNPLYPPYDVAVADVLEVWRYKCHLTGTMPTCEATPEVLLKMMREVREDVRGLVGKASR